MEAGACFSRATGVVGRALGLCVVTALTGCAASNSASYGVITTVAGDHAKSVGRPGGVTYSGDSGPATQAVMWDPSCVAVDGAGNLFIGDSAENRVRKVSVLTGDITTYAGTGSAGYSGDGGPATEATMYAPTDCSVDSAGNLYLADDANNVIRRVDATTGVITTVAGNGAGAGTPSGLFNGDGGPATSASINHSFGVLVDAAGNLYISDTGNQRVRKVDSTTGIITTIAGTGSHGHSGDGGPATKAQLYNPEGLAIDSAGNLYITEQANNDIRKIDAKSGTISTVAGTGNVSEQPVSGDGGLATKAVLGAPTKVAVDRQGNIFVADWDENAIREVVASTGVIVRVAGSSVQGYSGDGGMSAHAELSCPDGITFDASGAMYIADSNNAVVRKVTP